MATDVEAASDLYDLDPSEFVAARNALARRLRDDGQLEESTRVAKLRRPSAAAWALNRAARDQAELLDAALRAGEALRAAMESALGGDASALRAATADERAASDRFVTAAASYLGGAAGDAQQRLASTLRAAVVDDEVADELRRGVLTTDHEASAFGFVSGMELGTAAPAVRPARTRGGSPPSKRAPASADGRRATKEERAQEAAADKARAEARRRRAERQRELDRLVRSAERLARVADEAEDAAREARARADAAQAEATKARERLDG